MRLGDRPHDRQPEADAFTMPGVVAARESFEGPVCEVRREAGTLVGHIDLDFAR